MASAADERRAAPEAASSVFCQYTPAHPLPGSKPHPADISEATSLAATPAPPCAYPLLESLPDELVAEGRLSSLQLEAVQQCCDRHLRLMPTSPPTRCGFFLGDGAGVGKGRTLGGIILDSLARGRPRHLWFSTSSDLLIDAVRDLRDLGCHVPVHDGCASLDRSSRALGNDKDIGHGVVFSTYATLVSATCQQRELGSSRLAQLVQWCGGESFDGCLLFDECHKAKHWTGAAETSSKVASAVVELQRALPLARVVYCSATGATELADLAYMERLGLWGPNAEHPDFGAFADALGARGVCGLEMLAIEMKAAGAYVARGLSYREAEFERANAPLTRAQRASYDAAARFCARRLKPELLSAAAATGAPTASLMREYWACHQRFFQQLLVGMKVPTAVEIARRQLELGRCVVIGLQSTGEAALERQLGGNRTGAPCHVDAPVSLCAQMLIDFITLKFPIATPEDPKLRRAVEKADAAREAAVREAAEARAAVLKARGAAEVSASRTRLVAAERAKIDADKACARARTVLAGSASAAGEEIPQCVQARDRLLSEVSALDLPAAALDALIDGLGGPGQVAEMTGRKARLVRSPRGGWSYEMRARSAERSAEMEAINVAEKSAFMAGEKLVAIISDAASTGISLQADRRVSNRRRRVHITLELAWSADRNVQQLGRTHRANQVSAPIYILLTTDVGGEARFGSAVARRLCALGALTRGDRRAEIGTLDTCNVDTPWGAKAVRSLALAACAGRDGAFPPSLRGPRVAEIRAAFAALEIASTPREAEGVDVRHFLNRLVGLPLSAQARLFGAFSTCLDEALSAARSAGKLDDGVTELGGTTTEVVEDTVLWSDLATGAEARVVTVRTDRGVSFEAADATWREANGALRGRAGGGGDAGGASKAGGGGGGASARGAEEEEEDIVLLYDDDEDGGGGGGAVSGGPPARPLGGDLGESRGGFYRTRVRPPGGEHLYVLAIPTRGDASASSSANFSLIRPNAGPSSHEISSADLSRKYERCADAATARAGWERAHEAAAHSRLGGRFGEVQILVGSLLPMLSVLESIEASQAAGPAGVARGGPAHAAASSRAVRVAVPGGGHLLGFQVSPSLHVPLRKALAERSRGGQIAPLVVEPVARVEPAALARALAPPRSIASYFGGGNSTERARGAADLGDISASYADDEDLDDDHGDISDGQMSEMDMSDCDEEEGGARGRAAGRGHAGVTAARAGWSVLSDEESANLGTQRAAAARVAPGAHCAPRAGRGGNGGGRVLVAGQGCGAGGGRGSSERPTPSTGGAECGKRKSVLELLQSGANQRRREA